jgi:hypothetical protein
MMASGKIKDGGMAEWLKAPVLKTFLPFLQAQEDKP